jgi:nucleoside phosphorylase
MAPKTVPTSKYAEYSIGWICAQQSEFAAARAMLDDEHGVPATRGDADSNSYFLGRIGDHNVVIACLPAGTPGAAPAATVAASLQRTFRDVRVGLLVGVGSGAPSAADDVRLGDVVVGIPTSDTGGVVQFGPALEDNDDDVHGENTCSGSTNGAGGGAGTGRRFSRFLRTRCLNASPRVLLSALNVLQSEHRMSGSEASDILARAAQKYPRIKRQFAVPLAGGGSGGIGKEQEEETDLLFRGEYVHVGETSSSNVSCGSGNGSRTCDKCDVRMLVQRPSRDAQEPAVHYGVIASGDQEIACGVARDEAKKVFGALCFEREAAGLMNDFPCLVIRGIGDYADTHKSGRWQDYAAATAAALGKELLGYVPAQEVQEMAKIMDVMKDGEFPFRKLSLYYFTLLTVQF